MPVKVRCQSCEKVFAAPDAARGKLVKCPGCEGKVKVPAGDGAKAAGGAKSPAKKPAKKSDDHDDHEHALKSLDLNKLEDENARICPKCGQEIYDEETYECPACGLNFETGVTKEKQKGVDPKIFYKVVFKDSKQFLIDNKSFAIRTGIYTLVFTIVAGFCGFMVTWCVSPPPRYFWMGLFFIMSMVPFGWTWFLNGEIIKATMDKRETMPRINFDMFTSVALGIKFFLWQALMGAQLILPLVAIFLIRQGMQLPGIVLIAVTELLLFIMAPQVMVHMTMPVTTRGWLLPFQFKGWAKSFGACMTWCGLAFMALLPAVVPVAVASGVTYRSTIQLAADLTYNFEHNAAYGAAMEVYYAARNNPKKNEAAPEEPKADDEKYKTRDIAWKSMIVPSIGIVLSEALYGFAAIFVMRANGLFGLYFKKHLKLETMAKEVKWVAKGAKDDDDPATKKAKQKQQLINNIVAIVAFLAVIGGVAWWMMRKPDDGGIPVAPNAAPAGQPAAGQPAAGQPGAGGMMPGGGQVPATPAGAAAAGGVVIP